jgi:hypothetical protein
MTGAWGIGLSERAKEGQPTAPISSRKQLRKSGWRGRHNLVHMSYHARDRAVHDLVPWGFSSFISNSLICCSSFLFSFVRCSFN